MHNALAAALASLIVVSACTAHTAERRAASELQALLDEAVSNGIPGISAAVATRDRVVWTGVAGMANLQTGAPVRSDMLFGVGSITKTFVAVVILQLAEEGRLDLNSTAALLLGAAVAGIPNADKATLAQLLNHTGGVPSWEDDPAWIHDGRGERLDPYLTWSKAATLPYIKGHAALAPPGEKFSYANTNFTLLGMVIEKVTGNEAVDEIHRRILTPLGLKNIHLEGFEPMPPGQLPHRYHWATPTFRQEAGVNAAFPEVRPGLIDVSRSNLSCTPRASEMAQPRRGRRPGQHTRWQRINGSSI
jgi:D-alanyl-D-alanine carboxypeptidase